MLPKLIFFFRNFKFLPTAYSLRVTYKICDFRGNNIYWIHSLKYFRCAKSGLKFFIIVDIEINAWSPLFVNLKINIIFFWISWKVHKIQPIRLTFQKPGNLKFCEPFKINMNFKKPVFDFSVLYPKKVDQARN